MPDAWLMSLLLASLRVGVALFVLQPFALLRMPAMSRALLALTLGACLVAAAPPDISWPPAGGSMGIALAALREVLIGLSIAFGLIVAFAALAVAGRLLDDQVGFALAEIVDPSQRGHVSLFGLMLQLLGGTMFFLLDGHHGLIRALSASFEATPPGVGGLDIDLLRLAGSFGGAFAFGLTVVAPVVALLMLLDLGLAFVSRVLPQMNVLLMSLGLKAMLAVAALAISLQFAGGTLARLVGQWTPAVR